jgi:hypothetical protein
MTGMFVPAESCLLVTENALCKAGRGGDDRRGEIVANGWH